MMLGEKQRVFTRLLVSRLLPRAYELGFEITLGHAFRCADCLTGRKSSAHKNRLGIDLNLFKDGKYCVNTEDHRELGEFWESLHEGCRWGGRFREVDGNHYSFEHTGVM